MHLDSRNGTLTPSNEPHPSLCEALAGRLEFASIVDVDPGVRDALATLGEWMRTGECGSEAVAAWLVGSVRDAQLW
jgi:hypothetical protein